MGLDDFTYFQIKSKIFFRKSFGYLSAATKCRLISSTPYHSYIWRIYVSLCPACWCSASRLAIADVNLLAKSPQIIFGREQLKKNKSSSWSSMNSNDVVVSEVMKHSANGNVFLVFSISTKMDKGILSSLVLKVASVSYKKQLTNCLAKQICSELQKNKSWMTRSIRSPNSFN